MFYTYLEEFIHCLYRNLNIDQPEQLIKEEIAKKLKLSIDYRNNGVRFNNSIVLVRSTKQIEWQMFAHEMGHHLRHCGNQLNMHPLFRQLQEYQADFFAYHFCVPTFMLEQIKDVTIYDVMDQFNVEFDFAYTRLEMYQSKMLLRRNNHALQKG